jgi:hypothetical protein
LNPHSLPFRVNGLEIEPASFAESFRQVLASRAEAYAWNVKGGYRTGWELNVLLARCAQRRFHRGKPVSHHILIAAIWEVTRISWPAGLLQAIHFKSQGCIQN